jgi:crossover junction endodeoxyribonuclease RusA
MYATVRGRRVLSKAGRQYKIQVAQLVPQVEFIEEGDICLMARLYRPRKAGDLDNTLKALQDSLTGIMWKDDKQITEIHAYRFDDKDNPRAEVIISLANIR